MSKQRITYISFNKFTSNEIAILINGCKKNRSNTIEDYGVDLIPRKVKISKNVARKQKITYRW